MALGSEEATENGGLGVLRIAEHLGREEARDYGMVAVNDGALGLVQAPSAESRARATAARAAASASRSTSTCSTSA
jgi:hypothetical protein